MSHSVLSSKISSRREPFLYPLGFSSLASLRTHQCDVSPPKSPGFISIVLGDRQRVLIYLIVDAKFFKLVFVYVANTTFVVLLFYLCRKEPSVIFIPSPPVITFSEYTVGNVYEVRSIARLITIVSIFSKVTLFGQKHIVEAYHRPCYGIVHR